MESARPGARSVKRICSMEGYRPRCARGGSSPRRLCLRRSEQRCGAASFGLRWRAVKLLEAKIEIRETYVRGRFTTPKSKASRRVLELGPRTLAVLEEQWRGTAYRADDDLVFAHPTKGTPVETSSLAKRYLKPALARAGIEKPFRPFHDLRHTSLTHAAAAGNPQIYVQARAGHSQGSITERYMHAAQVLFPGAAAKSEARMFGTGPDVSTE